MTFCKTMAAARAYTGELMMLSQKQQQAHQAKIPHQSQEQCSQAYTRRSRLARLRMFEAPVQI
jgi:hypothetical protein